MDLIETFNALDDHTKLQVVAISVCVLGGLIFFYLLLAR